MLMAWMMSLGLTAQKKQDLPTRYATNRQATITLTDGRQVKYANSNIFMKNASFLYFKGQEAREARMDVIASVEFEDRVYVNIDNQLAFFVDSVGGNSLYCVELIDLESYRKSIVNNRTFTHVSLGSEFLETAADLNGEEGDIPYPIISKYYFLLDGKFVRAHDRDLRMALGKEQQRLMKTAISDPSFSWTDSAALLRLLRMISL